ncbi:tRNA (adenosine(37)-N6)-threonylcarbamoyltransferase complex ATPase subunit type 1 TsaE [Demequina muriae]|uniref:tRNA threonylcarbamoyladenosine biosynthesis protein TsaE n=1 Tax=Demequina muriae TaxID=3051664 RepID=A0ABT8GHG2_9MICO|nr:tRNA (adenosine(37)-N6)-threonylcarbamoyltransferase complex ATPase subunit type 1 TsaE [Demequina sp. EGI L300058]MDN4480873.1 tRNA (adenosine(37)-N6)-threonylcarbamoyltransferase complex ATPase subunit type 1 TsaE [Demequina sp. EGI L300058]
MIDVTLEAPDAEAMRDLGAQVIAPLLRSGDLVILTGDLGAGKTTFTQGLGSALGVRGDIASPTFIIARTHPSLVDGPDLVHVDAYRLGSLQELDDLDLDTSLDDAVTVVEWGEGAASLSEDRLHLTILRPRGGAVDMDDPSGGVRSVRITSHGDRWEGIALPGL